MQRISQRNQRTIARPAEIQGVGYITGRTVHLRFSAAPGGTGVVFVRTDLGPHACIGAHIDHVTGTHRRTTLGDGPLQVGLVEHVLAALGGLRIDNCYVELDAPEPPGLDGSALGFVNVLKDAGIVMQDCRTSVWAPRESIIVRHADATLALHPPQAGEWRQRTLRASYLLDYGQQSPIQPQIFTTDVTPETFVNDIAPCRTFLLEKEGMLLKQQGLGSRTQVSDLLVFGPNGPIQNSLRFGNEPARHKVLDMLGDLFLLGHDVIGHLVACRSGHPLNIELVRVLSRQLTQVLPGQRLAAA